MEKSKDYLHKKKKKTLKFDTPIGSIQCDCGNTIFIYPDMILPIEMWNKPKKKKLKTPK